MRRIQTLVRNQWAGLLALFLTLSGGTAVALEGTNTVDSGDIVNETVKANDVKDDSLTGTEIRDGKLSLDDFAKRASNVGFSVGGLDPGMCSYEPTADLSVKAGDVVIPAAGTKGAIDGLTFHPTTAPEDGPATIYVCNIADAEVFGGTVANYDVIVLDG